MNDDIFEWVPTKSVGPVKFGDDVKKHLETLPLRECADPFNDSEFMCFGYGEAEEPSYFLDEAGRVESIVSFSALKYRGVDIIGLPIERVIEILGVSPDEYGEDVEDVEGEVETPVQFDALGLQLWILDGVSNSAVVSFANEDEDE
tara:strand:- start:633 stop:1070 length:438 start_codon:yes stop_codon:yes gene_type:complete